MYCFCKYWRNEDLDLLIVTSYAAGFFDYSSIEHLWSRVSKKLTGVKANSSADVDSVAPALLSGVTKEEVEKEKEKKIEAFDRITDELTSIYLNDFTCNEFPVHVEKTV